LHVTAATLILINTDPDSKIAVGKKAEIYAGKFLKCLVECAASLGD
jgi:hypothetical protein